MTVPNNILQQVQTYQMSELAYLQNLNCFIATSNTRFKNFNELTANLGDTVNFDLPPRARATNSLVVTFIGAQQRIQPLTCDQQASYGIDFTAQQFIFNVEDYMEKFGKSAVEELGAVVEHNVALNALTSPYRFFGSPTSPITSFGQMAQMISDFRDYGSARGRLKVYLPVTSVPSIANSGLNQFALKRNDEIAMSWDLGEWDNVSFYQSNLLPKHISGNLAQAQTTLTLVSTNDPTGTNITALTFSGAGGADVNAIKVNDLFQFQDGVGSLPNLRYLTWTGHFPSAQPVQFRVTSSAASSGGTVTINISPALVSQQGINQNLNVALQAGMQIIGVPSHTAGYVVGGDALFLAMPRLPDTTPFPSATTADPDTGVSIRNYFGEQFGQNARGYVHDCIWGSTAVPEYTMRLIFPL